VKSYKQSVFYILLPILSLAPELFGQFQLQGNLYTEYSVDREYKKRYFENWTDFYLKKDEWRVGFRYEIHTPPYAFSQQEPGQGIYQRFIEYKNGGFTGTVGNFYAILGRGLVLRSYENRNLRWDTNLDGLKFDFKHTYADILLLGGRMRDLTGKRYDESIQGGEVRVKPFRQWHVGTTYMVTTLTGRGEMQTGSAFTQLNFKNVKFYTEYAMNDHPDRPKKGRAAYASGNLLIESFSLSAEVKDYRHFRLEEGLVYNNPPTVVREHLFALLNRHQLVQDANDEQGFLLEASYPVVGTGILTLNYNYTRNHDRLKLYQEMYGQFEWDYPEDWQWIWAAGREEDLEARYLNFVHSASWHFAEHDAVKVILEHQHSKIKLTDRQFYSQMVTLSYSRSPKYTISLIGERSTDQTSDKKFWGGVQADWNVYGKTDLTIFAGSRREGKICAGGVCVQKPEFKGVEVTLSAKW